MKRLQLFLHVYGGNLWKCNRDYWGWISIRTAWEVSGIVHRKG
jgi:hypothetical protein